MREHVASWKKGDKRKNKNENVRFEIKMIILLERDVVQGTRDLLYV